MYEVLRLQKETGNKFRWDGYVDGVNFKLYIPKWRVPEPTPITIYVRLFELSKTPGNNEGLTREKIEADPSLRSENIYAHIIRCNDHSKTVRFDPTGDYEDWEIGSPYIPESLLPKVDTKELIIEVKWK